MVSKRPPRIAVDARYIRPALSGIGRYTLNFLHGLAQIDMPDDLIVLTCPDTPLPEALANHPRFRIVQIPYLPWSPASQWHLPWKLRQLHIDLLYSPDSFGPLVGSFKKIITLHDITPLLFRHLLVRSRKAQAGIAWRTWLKRQCARCEAITTVSQHSADDIHRVLNVPRGKIHVVYNGIPKISPMAATNDEAAKQSDEKRILYVGRRDPCKNIAALIRAFAIVGQTEPLARLFIVGKPDPRYTQAEQLAEQLKLGDRVVFTGQLDDTSLEKLYQSARLLAFPSLYEGFGLPPLEAMQQGIPVVSSHHACMPEVLGDAALLVDPDNAQAFAASMLRVLQEPALADDLRERGLRRVEHFTIQKQAATLIEVWQRVLCA